MKIQSKLLIAVLVMAVITNFGCRNKNQEPAADGNKQSAAEKKSSSEPTVDKVIVARVNGIAITQNVLEQRMNAELTKAKAMPVDIQQRYKEELGRKLLDDMVVEILLDEKAEEKGVVITDEEVDAQIREMISKMQLSMLDFRRMLKVEGKTLDEFKSQTQRDLIYEKLLKLEFPDFSTEQSRKQLFNEYIEQLKQEAQIVYIESQ